MRQRGRETRWLAALLGALALAAPRAASAEPVVVLAAGDIASCESDGDEQTARLLGTLAGPILALGDLAYPGGSAREFAECYGPSWGRHKARTHPTPGNHDYRADGAEPYFAYFGAAAGRSGQGWYSFELGAWHIVSLNSNCDEIGGCSRRSAQGRWLAADLAAHPAPCTLAYWHHPRFNSGSAHPNATKMSTFWELLQRHGADLLLSGHEHVYERFGPQNAAGEAAADGIRQFTVGTGGRSLRGFGTIQPNSEARSGVAHGVLKLTLHPTSYDWEFVPVAGARYEDRGSASCVRAPELPPDAGG
jgi:3',5'-cyclic AMP phosphodiesterase CpdA